MFRQGSHSPGASTESQERYNNETRCKISSPLASIFNNSISTSTFPISWKCGYIKPLHKGGDWDCSNNYRPISVLPTCSKILEKHVKEHLFSHLESNNILYSHQSGLRSGQSTASLLLYHTGIYSRWYKAKDQRQYVVVLFLDVSKAFDTVNHPLLLSKLQHLRISDSSLSWFHSYISNRSQITSVCGVHSSLGFPLSGVPQGFVLGPTLFSAFINDFSDALSSGSSVLFANDTTIFITGKDHKLWNEPLQSF